MVMPNVYPAMALAPQTASYIASDSPLRAYYMGRDERLDNERRNYLREAGTLASQGNIPGAMGAAFRGGDVPTAINISNWDTGRRTQALTTLLEGARRADTPERWAALVSSVERVFGPEMVANYRDFNSRPNALTALEQAQLQLAQSHAALYSAQAATADQDLQMQRWWMGRFGFGASPTSVPTATPPPLPTSQAPVTAAPVSTDVSGVTMQTNPFQAAPSPFQMQPPAQSPAAPAAPIPAAPSPPPVAPGPPPLRTTAGTIPNGSRERPYRDRQTAERIGREGSHYYGPDGQVHLYAPTSIFPDISRPLMDQPTGPQPAPTPAGPAGALLPVGGALPYLVDRARGQTPAATPPAPSRQPFADYGNIPGVTPPSTLPGQAMSPSAAPPASRPPTGEPQTLDEIVDSMSPRNREAALLLLMKRDYAGLARMIEGVTPGTEAADRQFANEYMAWTTGGYADVQRQLVQLLGAQRSLESGGNITGPIVGSLPDFVNRFINPEAISNRQRVQEVVQRSLRQVLGAQFTQQEADQLIARAYDQTLPQAENLRRVNLLLQQIAASAEAKQSAAQYFQRNGTTRGWQGRMPAIADFQALFDPPTTTPATAAPTTAAPAAGTRYRYDPTTGQIEQQQ